MAGQIVPNVLDDISQQQRTNYIGFVSITILITDYFDTVVSEVRYIWQAKKGVVSWLFLINRYVIPLSFLVNLFAYLSPVWTPETCNRFIRFEGAMTLIGLSIVALLMLIRIYALYYERRWVVGCLGALWLLMVGSHAWLLSRGTAVMHNEKSGVHACTMIFAPSLSHIATSSAWCPLLFDSIVVFLTLYRLIPPLRRRRASFIMRRLVEDGLIYYCVIVAVTLAVTIQILTAPPGLKNISAQLELLLTVTMMSRITLSLREAAAKAQEMDLGRPPSLNPPSGIHFAVPRAVHVQPRIYAT